MFLLIQRSNNYGLALFPIFLERLFTHMHLSAANMTMWTWSFCWQLHQSETLVSLAVDVALMVVTSCSVFPISSDTEARVLAATHRWTVGRRYNRRRTLAHAVASSAIHSDSSTHRLGLNFHRLCQSWLDTDLSREHFPHHWCLCQQSVVPSLDLCKRVRALRYDQERNASDSYDKGPG